MIVRKNIYSNIKSNHASNTFAGTNNKCNYLNTDLVSFKGSEKTGQPSEEPKGIKGLVSKVRHTVSSKLEDMLDDRLFPPFRKIVNEREYMKARFKDIKGEKYLQQAKEDAVDKESLVLKLLKDRNNKVCIQTKDGINLDARYIKAKEGRPTIIFSHGNAYNLHVTGTFKRGYTALESFLKDGYGMLTYDYRGYGRSGGKTSEEGLCKDIEAVVDWVNKEKGVPNNRLILIGHSLGGAVTIDRASKVSEDDSFRAIVVINSFTNTKEVVKHRFYPLSFITKSKFKSDEKFEKIKSPLFLLHNLNDKDLSSKMSKRLRTLNPNSKLIYSPKGDHGVSDHLLHRFKDFVERQDRKIKWLNSFNYRRLNNWPF